MRTQRTGFEKSQILVLAVAIIFAIASAICFKLDSARFFWAWLVAWFYWFSIAAGAQGFFMIYRLTGGEWGKSVERILLAAARTYLPLLILFLPLLGAFHALYPWTHPDIVGASHKLQHKHAYLNIASWCIRAAIYFACWIGLNVMLTLSDQENVRRWSAFGLILLFLTGSFASYDWIMSLEPLWYSTIYGLLILTGQGIVGYAFALAVMHLLDQSYPQWAPPLTAKVLKDHGGILLTACILWAYCGFVQWLIIWIGNAPDTVTWYASRASDTWSILGWLVFIGQFGIPFQLLIWQAFKKRTRNLAAIGLFLLGVHLLEVYWLIEPALHSERYSLNWMVFVTLPTVGGFWVWAFARELKGVELASVANEYTPRLKELLNA